MTDHASDYTYWWIKYEDGGYTVRCGLCDDAEPIAGAPHVVEVKADEFVRRHRACGGDAA